jgi:glycosyltransferase involved in cell wall biosynthesis
MSVHEFSNIFRKGNKLLNELSNLQFIENHFEKQLNYPRSTIVIAALNEEQGIGLTIAELKETMLASNILVVDGHSRDRTVDVARNLGADVVFQDGLGKGDAISKALKQTNGNSDYIVLTDADFTYPAKYVRDMFKILETEPEVGMVCGNRFNGQIDSEALRSRFYLGNKLLAFAHKLLNGVTVRDPLTGLRVIRAEILNNWRLKSKGFDIEVELNSLVQKKGYKTVEVPIQYRQRLGEKKLKMRHGAVILKRIMAEALF